MKILIISNSEWDDNNSFGNTFSNFFSGMDLEFANIYCRSGMPNTKLCSRFLRLSDQQIVSYILGRRKDPAQRVNNMQENAASNDKAVAFAKRKRWAIIFLLRELLWKIGRPYSSEVRQFISEFKPDLLFLPTYPYTYINRMALRIQKDFGLPMVSYMSDDEYSLRLRSFSPLFWLRRFWQRKWVVKGLKASSKVYVISRVQQEDLEKDLKIRADILTKTYDFKQEPVYCRTNKELQMLYAGNISSGRYNTLLAISQAVARLRNAGQGIRLDIYTPTQLSEEMLQKLQNDGCYLHGRVAYAELLKIQQDADVAIHAEGFDRASMLEVRQSFSTKLVDLFYYGKCIFAAGAPEAASMTYLIEEDAAIVACTEEEIFDKLKMLTSKQGAIESYALKSYQCGKRNHDRSMAQIALRSALEEAIL